MLIKILKSSHFKISLIILISIILDSLLLTKSINPPAWDQGYHLSNVFKMYNILDENSLNITNKINLLLNITDSYRGPLTYFLSSIFLKIFNNSYFYAYLSNQIFNFICIFSIFNLGKLIKNQAVGIWASLIFTFSTLIINQRTDYLIDLSLTGFTTLTLLFFSKWYLHKKRSILFPSLSGIALALVFLIKPTGIILFFFPFIVIILKLFNNKKDHFESLKEIFLFLIIFSLLIFPWFSKHWLTIITSTINAWNWGVNYQDGLDINDIDSWLFYFKKLPSVFGFINFSIFAIIFFIEKILQRNLLKFNLGNLKKINLWFLIYFFNCYLIISLMSTKDVRFLMPLYPLFCIYLSSFINSYSNKLFPEERKKIILIISMTISIIFSNSGLIYKNKDHLESYNWPHSEIISTIKDNNQNVVSTLAILPDTKEINTFNIEAEASRQNEYVAVRQTISNMETYKDDLSYFDWFLVKSGNQGVMSNESKNLLNKYLLESNSFNIYKNWILPDKSKLMLLKRNYINTEVVKKDCILNNSKIYIKQINNGINIKMLEKGRDYISSNILIDFIGKNFKTSANVSLANGYFHKSFDQNSCYKLSQNIPINFPKGISENLIIKARILYKNGIIKPLDIAKRNLVINPEFIDKDFILMTNRISKVELLGNYLREGQFKNLFDLVGIINQSDPQQIYLKEAEKVYIQRYKDNRYLENQYSILISQILQRKVNEAKATIDSILKKDSSNGNAFLAKAIINVYLFDKKNARSAINQAKELEMSPESNEILKSIEGLTYLLEMRLIKAYKTFA